MLRKENFNECINIILDNILNKNDFLLKKILFHSFLIFVNTSILYTSKY